MKSKKWDTPKPHIQLNENIKSIIQKPDLEKHFFKYTETANKKPEKKPDYQFIIKSVNNEIERIDKKNLKLDQKYILEHSTFDHVEDKIKLIGKNIQNWLKINNNIILEQNND